MVHSDARLTCDQDVADSIPAGSDNILCKRNGFVEIDYDMFPVIILSLPSSDSRRAVVSF